MKKRFVLSTVVALALIGTIAPVNADPLPQRDIPKLIQQAPKRYLASEPGKVEQATWLFGPYVIPAGQDSNRITVDVQLPAGFVKAVSPELVDATNGTVPTEQEAHIHHAHWFRVTDDPNELYYIDGLEDATIPDFVPQEIVDALPQNAGISWVFGTGEEKTQGGFFPREALDDLDGNGVPDQQYGMEIDPLERQLLIYMIHNKTAQPLEVFVALDVEFMHGTAEEITSATGIPMHPLKGQLFGRTRDATRASPTLIGSGGTNGWTAEIDGTTIVAGGHSHPGAYGVFLTNQGPGGACSADFDGDGFPGITILRSRKIDHVPGSWPYSEDFQMGVAKYGWRAPVHAGDYLTQYGVYDIDGEVANPWGAMAADFALPESMGETKWSPSAADLAGMDTVDQKPHQHFEAMNHVGVYIDPLQAPEPYEATETGTCPANFEAASSAYLLGEDVPAVQQRLRSDQIGDPYFAAGITEGMQNHTWPTVDPTCGDFAGMGFGLANPSPETGWRADCEDKPDYVTDGSGIDTDSIHIAGFAFLPGNAGFPAALGAPARVQRGSTLTIYNEDAAANIRHSLTTCTWPCTGGYVSNFPFPDGMVDTGKLGNIDPIDGGLTGDDTIPMYELNTATLPADQDWFSYYCRIHPFMRGAFELV